MEKKLFPALMSGKKDVILYIEVNSGRFLNIRKSKKPLNIFLSGVGQV